VGIFVGGILIALVGLVDDLRGLGAAKKFSAQFLIAAVMYSLGFSIEKISTPWGALMLGSFSLPFTMIWIVGVINAMNLIDGLDGLASGVAFVAVATNFVIAAASSNALMMLFMAALAGAILGFLIYNFNPASIFMGDTGSMFLGFILATGSIVTSSKSYATVAMLVPILALGLPIMDTFLAMARRAVRGQPLFAADKEHVHHKLLAMGLSQRNAVIILYGVCLLFAAAALGVTFANGKQTAVILVMTAVVAIVFIRKLGYFSRMAEDASERRERNLALREQVRNVGEMLQSAASPANVWEAIQPLAPSMDVAEMSLTLSSRTSEGARETSRFEWRLESNPASERKALSLPIEASGERMGEILVAWQDGRTAISRDDEIALELLRDYMAGAAKRMAHKPAAPNVVPLKRKRA
jgi:UDP-GlcNAc:undecaprenyl-phosphate GlcNAc-1-phosphate transferase